MSLPVPNDFLDLVTDQMRRQPELLGELLRRLRVNVTKEMKESLREWEHDMNTAIGYGYRTDEERLNEALAADLLIANEWSRKHVAVLTDAARAYRDLLANGQRGPMSLPVCPEEAENER